MQRGNYLWGKNKNLPTSWMGPPLQERVYRWPGAQKKQPLQWELCIPCHSLSYWYSECSWSQGNLWHCLWLSETVISSTIFHLQSLAVPCMKLHRGTGNPPNSTLCWILSHGFISLEFILYHSKKAWVIKGNWSVNLRKARMSDFLGVVGLRVAGRSGAGVEDMEQISL